MLAPPTTVSRPCKYGHTRGRAANRECKECKRLRQQKYRVEYFDELLRTRFRYRHRHLEKIMFRSSKRNAKVKGFQHTIDITDISIPEFCPLLNMQLSRRGAGPREDDSPTLDRIDNSKGYVRGNVWVISWRANRLKSDGTLKELQLLVSNLTNVVRTYPWES